MWQCCDQGTSCQDRGQGRGSSLRDRDRGTRQLAYIVIMFPIIIGVTRGRGGALAPQESQIDRAFAATRRVLGLLVHPQCDPAGGAYSAPQTL